MATMGRGERTGRVAGDGSALCVRTDRAPAPVRVDAAEERWLHAVAARLPDVNVVAAALAA